MEWSGDAERARLTTRPRQAEQPQRDRTTVHGDDSARHRDEHTHLDEPLALPPTDCALRRTAAGSVARGGSMRDAAGCGVRSSAMSKPFRPALHCVLLSATWFVRCSHFAIVPAVRSRERSRRRSERRSVTLQTTHDMIRTTASRAATLLAATAARRAVATAATRAAALRFTAAAAAPVRALHWRTRHHAAPSTPVAAPLTPVSEVFPQPPEMIAGQQTRTRTGRERENLREPAAVHCAHLSLLPLCCVCHSCTHQGTRGVFEDAQEKSGRQR